MTRWSDHSSKACATFHIAWPRTFIPRLLLVLCCFLIPKVYIRNKMAAQARTNTTGCRIHAPSVRTCLGDTTFDISRIYTPYFISKIWSCLLGKDGEKGSSGILRKRINTIRTLIWDVKVQPTWATGFQLAAPVVCLNLEKVSHFQWTTKNS